MKTAENALADNPYTPPGPNLADGWLPRRWPRWAMAAATVAARTWIALSLAAFGAGLAINALTERENLLESDDPYCVGLLVAVFCGGIVLLSSLAEAVGGSKLLQRLAYFGLLLGTAALMVGWDIAHPNTEVSGIFTFLGTAIAATGVAIYPFVSAPLSKLYVALLSLPGVLFLLGYAHVMAAMHARWS